MKGNVKKQIEKIFRMNSGEFRQYMEEKQPEIDKYIEKEKERKRRSHDSPSWYKPIGKI